MPFVSRPLLPSHRLVHSIQVRLDARLYYVGACAPAGDLLFIRAKPHVNLADRVLVLNQGRFVNDLRMPFDRPRSREVRFLRSFLDMKQEVLISMTDHTNVPSRHRNSR